jgi:hypothetical protein
MMILKKTFCSRYKIILEMQTYAQLENFYSRDDFVKAAYEHMQTSVGNIRDVMVHLKQLKC